MTLIKVIVLASKIAVSLANLFGYCYFGRYATESFTLYISDSLYNANWQNLPVELQKYIIIIMINAQKPKFYHGFGMVYLNLETFCKMIQTVYTYFMIFKTVTTD